MGLISLLQQFGRELDLAVTAGSVARARDAVAENERRRNVLDALQGASGPTPGDERDAPAPVAAGVD